MAVGRWHDARYDVVVVPAAEVLVLEKGAVIQPIVEVSGKRSVKHPAGIVTRGGGGVRTICTVRVAEDAGTIRRNTVVVVHPYAMWYGW